MRQPIYSPKGSYFAFEPNNSSLDEECLPDIRTGIYDGRFSKKFSLPNMALGTATMMLLMAVAVTVQCDGCIVVHTEAALKNGAKEQEILEALGVAVNVKAGSALIYSARALDAVKAKTVGSGAPEDRNAASS